MRPTIARLAAACALAVTFTGTAVAGNPNAPGQQKKDDAAAVQPAQQDQQQATQASATNPSGPNGQATAPGQVKKSEQVPAPAPAEQAAPQQQAQASSQPSHAAPGQMKTQASSGSSSSSSSAQAGVKPSSTTTHWTHCRTGGSAGAATCTAQGGTPNVGADVSKRYGNGKTAAQIAVSRGAPAGTLITGPGNSQPHKVSDCRHKSNPSGGVDVHAVKSYSTSCATETQQAPSTPQVSVTHVCGQDIVTTLSQSVIGVLHGHSEHLMTNTHSAHFTKHADSVVFGQTASTRVVPTTETCGSSSNSGPSTSTSNGSSNTSTSSNTSNTSNTTSNTSSTSNASSNTTSNTSNASSSSTSNTSNASSGTQSANGVLGAETTQAKPKTSSSGGVLDTVSNVAGTSLPFTGFPLWIAALVGLGLLASGALFWRRGGASV